MAQKNPKGLNLLEKLEPSTKPEIAALQQSISAGGDEKPPKEKKPKKEKKEKKEKSPLVEKKREKKTRREAEIIFDTAAIPHNAMGAEERSIATALAEEVKAEKKRRRTELIKRTTAIILIVLSVYMVFLIYGLLNTEYVYDAEGKVVPQVMSVGKIRALSNYNTMRGYYLRARNEYEKILTLDYRVASNTDGNLTLIGTEYLAEVDVLNDLYKEIQSAENSTEYTQLKAMLLYWLENDAAPYCGNLSQAIAYNNEDSLAVALEAQNNTYYDFSSLTALLISLGETVYGVDLDDLRQWSPEEFVRDKLGDLTYGG